VNGVSIYYETYGDGRPVLVLHGATAFLETTHNQIRGLVPGHRVIAVDSRAQGRSTDSDAPLTYAQMDDDMIKLLDSMQIQQVDVVGWSDGGIIGLDMAMKHPERVRRLVAMGANYDVDGVDFDAVDPGSFSDVKLVYDRIAPDPSHFPVMLKKVMTMIHTEPHYTTAELGQIRAPTLIIAGERDVIRADHTDKLAAAIPGATKVIVAGATHMGPLEKPEIYNSMIVEFLDAPINGARRT
jgi:pimeloyl-ACP methyl ester carboxylesterase